MNAAEIYEKAIAQLESNQIDCGEFNKMIEPLKDVEPVKHGHWIDDQTDMVCSCCGESFSSEIVYMCNPFRKPKRCLECGAYMDEEVNDDQEIL